MIERIVDVPRVRDGGPDDPDWHPLQHYFGLTAFGANVFVARAAGQELVAAHDERSSGQEELYLVTSGSARFWLDGRERDVPAGHVVALPSPATRRRAVALEPGTTLVAIGAQARPDGFPSTWDRGHFEGLPRARPPA